jgi:HPt (histidine-containing phosphotransfer) domain-containing protein
MILGLGAREARSGLDQATRALSAGDMAALARTAHTMKSSTGAVGALACREAACRLEDAARSHDRTGAGVALAELEREAAKVLAAWEDMAGPDGTAPSGEDGPGAEDA